MRPFRTIMAGLLIAVPAIAVTPNARAETDWMGQAQRFFNQGNGSDSRDAYERGRRDELRRQQAERDRSYRQSYDQRWHNNDNGRWRGGYRGSPPDNQNNGGFGEH